MIERIADDLREAYTNFDPLLPLSGDSKFYVERRNNPLSEIKWDLLNENPIPPKFLFSGHRGSGKSTELRTLVADEGIQSKYFTVHYSIRDILDPADLKYTDLLLSIGLRIFAEAATAKLRLKRRLLDELNRWIGLVEIEKENIAEEDGEVEASAGLSAFFAKVQAKLKLEHTSRETIRQTIEPYVSELISTINSIVAEVKSKSGKREVLVAIDDLDKPDLTLAKELFYERQTSLVQPNCSIIYTIPIAILYSPEAGQVGRAFTESYVLPNVTITKQHDRRQPDEEGCALMRDFVLKRMSENLMDDDALGHAVSISGGVFREMARVIRIAASKAYARGEDKVEITDVKKAESQIRNEFRRMLETEDYDALKEIYEKQELRGSETCAKLLHSMSVLEYRNDENWCDVHPVVHPIISRMIEEEKKEGQI